MKRVSLFFLLALTCLGFGGCAKPNNLPGLTVIIDQAKISVTKAENNLIDNKNIFKSVFENTDLSEIKHIHIGDKVTLDFGSNLLDKVIIQEIFLNSNGEKLYSDETLKEILFTREKSKYFFTVEKTLVSALSSVHIEGKTDLRGYKIETTKGEIKDTYLFVIKTDSY